MNQSLEVLKEKFDEHRATRRRQGRLPKELWDLAVRAAEEHGPTKAAHAAKLDYYQLRARIEAKNAPAQLTCSEVVEVRNSESEELPLVQMTNGNGCTLAFYRETMLLKTLISEFLKSC